MNAFRFARCGLYLLLPIAALSGCSPSNSNNTANDNAATPSATSAAANIAANNSATNSAVISATPSTQTPPRAALASVWVPGRDDKLHLRPVSKAAMDTQKKFKNPTAALNDIVRMAPSYFPPNTRVLDWHDDGPSVSVNLNRNLVTPNFWSKRGESQTELAVYALVNSASTSAGGVKPVVLQVEKKPLSTLGEMDTSDSIEPNSRLQAKPGVSSSSSSSKTSTSSTHGTGSGEP